MEGETRFHLKDAKFSVKNTSWKNMKRMSM